MSTALKDRTPNPPDAQASGRSLITVCHVLHNLTVGGAELLAAEIARQLHPRFRFVFACIDRRGELADRLEAEGFTVHAMHRRPGFDWRCVRRLAEVLRRENVSVVNAHQYAPFFYSAMSRFGGPQVPILFTEHGRMFPDRRRWKRVLANRLLLKRCDRVVGVGETVRKALIDQEGIAARRVSVVYNGIDLDRFDATQVRRDVVRQELGYADDDVLIVQVARLDPIKDHGTALRAFARLWRRCPSARLIIVGDGVERGAIETKIDELGVGDGVRLLGTRHDVPRLFAAADVCLLTSVSEGVPLTVLEAMACGVPVVATRVGGVSEIVSDGESGLLADPGDDAKLAEHLQKFAEDPVLRSRSGAAGRRCVGRSFSAAQMLRKYASLYEDMPPTRRA
ncbi:MAG: glycosyltransferase [Planctomycetaceae bacterium]|nr:glycosyltransferase [Planctomycetaceae bacterium]